MNAFRWSMMGLLLLGIGCNLNRGTESEDPPIQIQRNMFTQFKGKPQRSSGFFKDGSSMRMPVEGTVATEDEISVAADQGNPSSALPPSISMRSLQRGKERYQIYCAPCHGFAGFGDGSVVERVRRGEQKNWSVASFHDPLVREKTDAHYLDVIGNGYGRMKSYGLQVSRADRIDIVSYIRALQRSQNSPAEALPASLKRNLP